MYLLTMTDSTTGKKMVNDLELADDNAIYDFLNDVAMMDIYEKVSFCTNAVSDEIAEVETYHKNWEFLPITITVIKSD